jgi:hypothetical protein
VRAQCVTDCTGAGSFAQSAAEQPTILFDHISIVNADQPLTLFNKLNKPGFGVRPTRSGLQSALGLLEVAPQNVDSRSLAAGAGKDSLDSSSGNHDEAEPGPDRG